MSCVVDLRFSLSLSCSGALGLEDVHGPHDVLPADRALVHPLATLGAGHHVTALQENAVDHSVHADPAQVVVMDRQRTFLTICERKSNTQEGDWKGLKTTFNKVSVSCAEEG